MKFQKINKLNDEQFVRLTGIKRTIFNKVIEILKEADYGKNHDFNIFKDSKIKFLPETTVLIDLGYQRVRNIHKKVLLWKIVKEN